MQIKGATVLITGGTDGIGLELARQMQAKGASIIVCGRDKGRLASAAAEGFTAIEADVSSAHGCALLFEKVAEQPITILINNAGAGVDYDVNAPIKLSAVDKIAFLNFNAPMHLIANLLDKLKAAPEAAIVNVTSGLAIAPRAGGPVYCATKAGLRSFTQAIRYQLKDTNVHVIDALPPVVDTALTAGREAKKMSPRDCAAEIIAGIEKNKADVNVGLVKILQLVNSISPRLARKIMIRF